MAMPPDYDPVDQDPSMARYYPQGGYGDEQAYYTSARAGYGNIPPGLLGGTYAVGAGAGSGMQNMMSDLGRMVRPVTYAPPAIAAVGYGGMYMERTGFARSGLRTLGLGDVPRGTTAVEYGVAHAGDFGERMAVGGANVAAQGAGMLFGATVGSTIAGGIGAVLGAPLGPLGSMLGAGIGKMFGGYMMGSAGANYLGDALSQRRDMQNFLEAASFRFVGAGSEMADPRMGAGMGVKARQQVSNTIREMDIGDRFMNTEELTQIMKSSAQQGLFAGTQNMDDFKKRFKDVVDNVKVVTRVLHQTLEEGVKTIKDLQTIGVNPNEVRDVITRSDALGKVAGRTGTEMMQIGMQGAEMFRGTGIAMTIGYQQNQMNLAAIRSARDAKELSQEAIAQAGGEEALAQRMTAGALGSAQQGMGRGYNAAFYNAGMPGAGFDVAAFNKAMMGGGGDFVGLAQTAAQNLGDPRKLIHYQANQEQFLSDMGKQFGGQGLMLGNMGQLMSNAAFLQQQTGGSMEDAFRYTAQLQGKSKPEIDTMLAQMRSAQKSFAANQAGLSATTAKMAGDEASQNFILTRWKEAISDEIKGAVDPISKGANYVVDDVREGVIGWHERNNMGLQRYDTSGWGLDKARSRGFGQLDDRASKDYVYNAAKRQTVDISKDGLLATTAGDALRKVIMSGALEKEIGAFKYDMVDAKDARGVILGEISTGDGLITKGAGAGFMVGGVPGAIGGTLAGAVAKATMDKKTLTISHEELQRIADENRLITRATSQSQATKVDSDLSQRTTSNAAEFLMTNNVRDMSWRDIAAKIAGKKSFSDVTQTEYDAVVQTVATMPELMKKHDQAREVVRNVTGAGEAASVVGIKDAVTTLKDAKRQYEESIGVKEGTIAQEAFPLLLQANKADQMRGQARQEANSLAAVAKASGKPEDAARAKEAEARAIKAEKDYYQIGGEFMMVQTKTETRRGPMGAFSHVSDQSEAQDILNYGNTTGVKSTMFNTAQAAGKTIMELQANRGADLTTRALFSDIESSNLTSDEKLLAKSAATKLRGGQLSDLLSLKDADDVGMAALRKSPLGGVLLKSAKDYESLSSLQPGASKAAADTAVKALLPNLSDTERAKKVEQVQNEGGMVVAQQAYQAQLGVVAGDKGAAAATPGGQGTESGNAQAMQETQTSINMQVASILSAIEQRLRPGGH